MLTRLRMRGRVLPPVGGGVVPLRLIVHSLREALWGDAGTQGFRQQLTDRIGLDYWVFVNSGRSALSVVIMGLKELHPERDEVVIPAYTSYSVPAAVVRAGLRVRLCEVETETLGLSPKELERVVTSRTLCVVPSHLYGVPCQIHMIWKIACDHGIPVVEDAAQAMGVRYGGWPVGTSGTAAVFSLSRGKILPAAGGGLIGTSSDGLAERCTRIVERSRSENPQRTCVGWHSAVETVLMAVFIRPSLYWLPASLPFLKLGASVYDPDFQIGPMSLFQKALASRLLQTLEKLREIRQAHATRLDRLIAELRDINDLVCIRPKEEEEGGYLRLPVLIGDPAMRNRILTTLQKQGLGATGGYPLALSMVPDLRPHLACADDRFPVAERISQQLVTLPTHGWVRERDIEATVDVFKRCSRERIGEQPCASQVCVSV